MNNKANKNGSYLFEAQNIEKYFGQITALGGVDFQVGKQEIVALCGDNGAGKSTLIKILSGIYTPDKGKLMWEGKEVQLRNSKDAINLGISTVYQDLGLVDLISIYRNIFLGREESVCTEKGPIRFIKIGKAREEAKRALDNTGITIRSIDETAAKLSGGERQSIAIARAIYFETKLLIMDEPCAALGLKETAKVLGIIEKAREKGVSVIFISHNVHHAYPIADKFTILAHGKIVGNFPKGQKSIKELSDIITSGGENT